MFENKWFYLVFAFFGGSTMSAQAIHYFIGGGAAASSWARSALVVGQFLVGAVVAFWGWKKYRTMAGDH